jgi:ABC-type sugar transport system ATPase subunit
VGIEILADAFVAAEARSDFLLEARNVSKSFPGVLAVADVDLAVRPGEVVAVVGENGAGKSTLMKLIAGIYPADSFEGELIVDGIPRRFRTMRDAEAVGIVLVPQELHIAPGLSIAENMFMGRLPGNRGFVDQAKLHTLAAERLRFFGIDAPTDAPAGILSPSEQRLVIIAAALAKSAKLIIFDEPTAALTQDESRRLFAHIQRVQQQGVGCVYITHRLDEIKEVADRVVVMRNGGVVARFDTPRGHHSEIVRAMIGRDPDAIAAERISRRTTPIMTVSHIRLRDPHDENRLRVDDVSFSLHRGEILGLFGLVGAGRTEMAQAVFGVWPGMIEGRVEIDGHAGLPKTPREAIARGIGMLTENRKRTGLIENQTVLSNVSAASLDDVSGFLLIDSSKEHDRNDGLIRELDVRPPRLDAPVDAFSGGNQQKILLARWLATRPKVLILDEPTFGVDIGARFELYRLVRTMVEDGLAVLMISSDLTEVVQECDRILVMYKGRLTGEFDHGASRHAVMAAATGGGR